MGSTFITMHLSVVFLALLALAAAVPITPTLHAADQELLSKQQNVIALLENIVGGLPVENLHDLGVNYDIELNLVNYENPSVVKYYAGLVKSGHVLPHDLPHSVSVSVLRKEISLLTEILLGAKDYQTFLSTAAWARVHVNQHQFVQAFVCAVLQRHDMQGVILPPVYEVYPHYFFDTRVIQAVEEFTHRHGYESHGQGDHHIYVNYTSHLPHGEHQIAYFTEDIGLSAYYTYVHLTSHMLIPTVQANAPKVGQNGFQYVSGEAEPLVGHGSYFYYLHQQLLARYNLERLGQGLDSIRDLDYYYEHIETPYNPHLRYMNGVNFPSRDDHIYVTPRSHNYHLIQLVRKLENNIMDAIDRGHVLTPHGNFLSLYQPQGLNILGELIEGTGRSVNPRFYGSLQAAAKVLLGNSPSFSNIWEYSPSALELGETAVRDPIFYQLFARILGIFKHYQESLPAYQYNDILVPGVHITKVDISELLTYFKNYEVNLNNAVPQPVGLHQEHQPYPNVIAHLKRLDHKPYEYSIHVNVETPVPNAVVRVYIGPKYNYKGLPIDINHDRHYFFEIDQFVYDLPVGQSVIVRNSHQATGQSYDLPSVQQIKSHVESAIRSQSPHYVVEPQQLYGFPARLTLPKGSHSGYPLQFFVIISSGVEHLPVHYGPIVPEEWMAYGPGHFQVVGVEEYSQFNKYPVDPISGVLQTLDVVPDFESHIIPEGDWHWGHLYRRYPGSYYYPQWQQVHHNVEGRVSGVHHSVAHEHHYPNHVQYPGVLKSNMHSPIQGSGVVDENAQVYRHIVTHKSPVSQHAPLYDPVQPVQGSLHSQEQQDVYQGSGHYSGVSDYHGSYPSGVFQGWEGHDQSLHNYYKSRHISEIIGGAVSLDGKPLGFPFDRPLAHNVFYAQNIYVADVVVYHQDDLVSEI